MANDLDLLLNLIQNPSKIKDSDASSIGEMTQKLSKVQKLIDNGTHKYAISPWKGSGFQTRVVDEEGKEYVFTARSKTALYNRLYRFYFGDNARVRMCDLFEEWIIERIKTGLSPRTIKRYREAYEKYLEGSAIDTIPLVKITPVMATDFFNNLIVEYKLTDKQYGNIVVIPNKLFSYATLKGIMQQNPMKDNMINRRALKHTKAAKTADRVYFEDERKKFLVATKELIEADPDRSDYYAILLLWVLALRIGELSALKWSDIDFCAREIHIQRMESRGDDNRPVIVDHCKGNSPSADRILPISDYELGLFAQIRELNERHGFVSEYIFVGYNYKTGKVDRRTIKNIDCSIRRICRRAGIPEKSAHDIRRSVASMLFANGESLESIRKLLGHSDLRTTSEYIVDYNGTDDRRERIHSILAKDLPMNVKEDGSKDNKAGRKRKHGLINKYPRSAKVIELHPSRFKIKDTSGLSD